MAKILKNLTGLISLIRPIRLIGFGQKTKVFISFLIFIGLVFGTYFAYTRAYTPGDTSGVKKVMPPPYSDPSLVGYWKMDDNAGSTTVTDDSGNGNNGTAQANTNTKSTTDAIHNRALTFNGTSDYVNVGTSATIDITSAITLSAWVSLNAISDVSILSKSNPSPVAPYHQYILHISSGGKLYLSGDNGGTVQIYAIDTTNFPVSGWHHVLATHDGVWSRLYIDGIQRVATNTYTGGFVSHPTWPLNIGKIAYDSCFPNGSISDVRIYNRALSANEVKQLYMRGRP